MKALWQRFGTPVLVLLLALAIVVTLTRNWNAWEGTRVEQTTNDANVRRDLTPLSTKVAGLVRAVKVGDYAHVRRGDELVLLEDDDYRAHVAQAAAAVEAAKAALENNRRQRALQDSRIQRALADEQNAVLDQLRRANKVRDIADVLPDETEHTGRYHEAVRDELWSAAQAGARAATSRGLVSARIICSRRWQRAPTATFGLRDAAQASRLSFASVALWWFLFSIPLLRRVPEPEIPVRTKVPDYAKRLPPGIQRFTQPAAIQDADHLSFLQGGGHGGSHPHLVHHFIAACRGDEPAMPDAETSVNWTMVGICAHQSALQNGEKIAIPEF